jgi:hypothetical protein
MRDPARSRRRPTLDLLTPLGGERWWLLLAASAALFQIAATVRALLRPHPLALDVDAALYQHGGWYITQGAVLYVDIWDTAAPLSFFLPALLSRVAGGDMLVLHIASVITTGMAAIVVVLLIGGLTVELTGEPRSGVIAGLVMLTFVGFYVLPTLGFSVKHHVLLFGLLGLLLALRDRPFLSGLVTAASPGFWLPGAVFPLLALGILWHRHGGRACRRALAGMAACSFAILIPIFYWGVFGEMVQEVLLAQLLAPEPQSLVDRLEKGARFLLFTIPLALVAPLGVLRRSHRRSSPWWVAAGGTCFLVQVLFLDFDNFPDLIPALAFVAIGVGLLAADATPRLLALIAALLLAALLLNPMIRAVASEDGDPAAKLTEVREVQGYVVPSMQAIYWNQIEPESCHYRLSPTEQTWIARTRALGREECPPRR